MTQNKPPSSPQQPPTSECYVCGRPFGSHSIRIHERQCLKKWQAENDSLPADMRLAEPKRKSEKPLDPAVAAPVSPTRDDPVQAQAQAQAEGGAEAATQRPGSSRKSPMFPCYLCGRLFTVHSIYIHEPQCLEAWRRENDKLPSAKRRPEPLKPDVKFTRDGKVDFASINEDNWQSHLSQLVPCKYCARTFNPERVQIHENSCKG